MTLAYLAALWHSFTSHFGAHSNSDGFLLRSQLSYTSSDLFFQRGQLQGHQVILLLGSITQSIRSPYILFISLDTLLFLQKLENSLPLTLPSPTQCRHPADKPFLIRTLYWFLPLLTSGNTHCSIQLCLVYVRVCKSARWLDLNLLEDDVKLQSCTWHLWLQAAAM